MNKLYSWQGGTSTSFGAAANWFDVTDGITAASPPGAGDSVELTGAGTIDGMATGLTALTVMNTSGAGYALGATLGVSAIEVAGQLELTSGATLTADTATIDGGMLILADGSLLQDTGQALALTVSGTGASVLQVKSGAFLHVGTGMVVVGSGVSQTGTLLVTGGTLFADAPTDSAGATLEIGTQGANGAVTLSSGGAITQFEVDVGVSGHGLLTLGAATQLTASNFSGGPALVLGATAPGAASAGQGTLVSLGATISAYGGDTLIGDTGQGDMVAGGGTFFAGGVTLGLALGASGTLSIGANESWTASTVVVGDAGNGTIQMTASAPGSGSGTIGYLSLGTAGGNGTLAIRHETLHVQDFANVGQGGGNNSIIIGAGGVWDGAGQNLFLEPVAAGGGDTLSVAGAGATFDAGSLFGFAGTQIRFGAGAQAVLGDNPATDGVGTAGGTITVTDAVLAVGAVMGVRANGTMTISGTSSVSASDGLLVFDPGSTVAIEGGTVNSSSASGTALQVSEGGTLALSGGTLNTAGEFLIGSDPDGNAVPAGTLTASGGAVITSSATAGAAVVIGGSGLPDVAGLTGARWTVSGDMSLTTGGDVVLSAGAALDVSGRLQMGEQRTFGNTDSLSVSGGSLMASTLIVGLGTLSISAGSTLVAGSAAGGLALAAGVIGGDYAGPASVVIDASHALVEGSGEVGGTLTVSDGGTLSITNTSTEAGVGAALTVDGGTLLVTGSHTALRLGGALLETGQTAVADSVTINAGAQASIADGFLVSEGTAGIDGTGTTVHVAGLVRIGTADATMLTVSGGAELDVTPAGGQAATGMLIESGNDQTSFVAVTGASHLSVATALVIAQQDRGELALSNGGTVSAGSVMIGGDSATHGSLSLAGSGDVLTTQLLTINTAGTVTLGTGSHLSAGGLLIGVAGQGVATANAAMLDIAGGKLSVFGGASVHGAVVLSQGGTLSVSNALTLWAGSTVIGQGVLGAGNIVDLGRIGNDYGTMTCLGPINGTGLLSVANGGDVVLAHGEASTVGLVFGAYGTFTAAGVGMISGTVAGWTTGDVFDFTGAHIASDSLSGHVLTLFDGSGHVLGRETFAGSFTSSNFSLSADHGAGTLLAFHA